MPTTGLSVNHNKIIEIGAIKCRSGKEIDRFSTFVDPQEKIPYHITELTNITDQMVKGALDIKDALEKFLVFIEDSVLVAHNASFDMGFIRKLAKELKHQDIRNPVIDTLEFARFLFPEMKNHRLNTLANKFKVPLDNHHRAIDDSIALSKILFSLLIEAKKRGITNLIQLNSYSGLNLTKSRPFHCCIYAKDQTGKKNLFKLVSLSHTRFFNKVPCIPKSLLNTEIRKGLIISSGCEKGELYETALNKTLEELEAIATFYDVLEIQPADNYMHLVEQKLVASKRHLEEAIQRIYTVGKKLNLPIIATGNVHYLHKHDKLCRDIIINGITGFSPLKNIKKPDLHFRTTQEMLELFSHLGEKAAYEVVVKNTNELADEFENIELFPEKPFFPVFNGAEKEIRDTCYKTAVSLYGDKLPNIVVERLEKELKPIIEFGFATLYLISQRLVKKSKKDGYLVGSRGSVGSSVVALMLDISEVNPLPPHYICPSCKYSEWFTDGSVSSGFDLPNKNCPKCNEALKMDGQDIPFETFLGFKGDKVPDIDLNFSGEYQPVAHNYTKELFGEKNVFKAGTVGTVAEKTAFGLVKKFEETNGLTWRTAEVLRLADTCTGVKRNTGQHPGGIIVVPNYIEVEDITPVQFPADDVDAEWKTTHFDYHAFDDNLLKLDILGHTDPTMMKKLHDLTNINPTEIDMNDKKVLSLFNSPDALNVTAEQIRSDVGVYGIPDFGSRFTRKMLSETRPEKFSDLIQISGLSHGTGVWLGNAQELIKNGTCTISTVIGCRDNIMLYLIYNGMDSALAFKITESVRRGNGLTDEWIEEMKKVGVPNWYIQSCLKIEYMFPRAHAAAYCISAVRSAFYKLYYPIEFYSAIFSVNYNGNFDITTCCQGYDAILNKIIEIESQGNQMTAKDKNSLEMLELALEMTARGFHFKNIDLYKSAATSFVIDDHSLIVPFSAIQGIGDNAANNIVNATKTGEILSIEDFQNKAKISATAIQALKDLGCFHGIPETNQLTLF
nr:PolC-type DNA polymerase III [Lederbergia sp. NSJ-179]